MLRLSLIRPVPLRAVCGVKSINLIKTFSYSTASTTTAPDTIKNESLVEAEPDSAIADKYIEDLGELPRLDSLSIVKQGLKLNMNKEIQDDILEAPQPLQLEESVKALNMLFFRRRRMDSNFDADCVKVYKQLAEEYKNRAAIAQKLDDPYLVDRESFENVLLFLNEAKVEETAEQVIKNSPVAIGSQNFHKTEAGESRGRNSTWSEILFFLVLSTVCAMTALGLAVPGARVYFLNPLRNLLGLPNQEQEEKEARLRRRNAKLEAEQTARRDQIRQVLQKGSD
ncbi:tpiA [Acrasis kona]|uniref:TpiA n=1 Tax=Acrasis kona TaxID=1008807 RepID=A0AAW2YRQ3_9EUKA